MQLSLLIGKSILTPQGEELGYVKGAYLSRDLTKLACLAAVDGEEEEFYLPARAVIACRDAVIAKKCRLSSPVGVPAPVGLGAYSDGGESLGVVSDWLFGDVDPVFVTVKEGVRTSYACGQVLFGEKVIIYPEGKRPASKRPAPAKKPSPKKNEEVEGNEAERNEAEGKEVPAAPPAAEQKVPYGHRDLLGRTVKRSVLDELGMPVARAGETVTPAVLARARQSNLLLALAANTLF